MFVVRSTSKLMGCSLMPFTASSKSLLPTQKRPSPSLSLSSSVVFIITSLSEAVRFRRPWITSKRKSPSMGNEFLVLITLERAASRLLSAVLDTVNLIL